MPEKPPEEPLGRVREPRSADSARIWGIDAARALAVFGMFTVHLGVASIGLLPEEPAEAFHRLARGNSSALFAFLAGVSVALMTGRTTPLTGAPRRRATERILVRAVVIALMGGLLDLLGAPIAIILTYYGGFFLLAVPLVRLRASQLWAAAAAAALAGPQLSFLIREAMEPTGPRTSSLGSLTEFFLTGYYPAFTFMAFVIAGMAVGRTDLSSAGTRLRLAGAGAGLALLGYGGSWLLLYPLGGLDRLVEHTLLGASANGSAFPADPVLADPAREAMAEQLHDIRGQVPTDSAWWLVVGTPHSGTTFEIAAATGTALLALAACLWLAEAAGRVLYPLTAVGSMALTVYAGHIVVIAVMGYSAMDEAPYRLELFVLGALAFAWLWRALVGRGPLERGVGASADAVTRLTAQRD